MIGMHSLLVAKEIEARLPMKGSSCAENRQRLSHKVRCIRKALCLQRHGAFLYRKISAGIHDQVAHVRFHTQRSAVGRAIQLYQAAFAQLKSMIIPIGERQLFFTFWQRLPCSRVRKIKNRTCSGMLFLWQMECVIVPYLGAENCSSCPSIG